MVAFKPHIGKNVIETLTLGMYEDARFIFREYIQNAADQIDEAVELEILNSRADGEINIEIDAKNRRITITDNATGVKAENVLSFLGNVAASTKDPYSRKGFRGIGRLGGLGYCDTLKFETSYKGESVKSEMIMDAELLKKTITDKKYVDDASTLISFITDVSTTNEEPLDSHYFNVTLENVTNDELLNKNSVKDYLSMVAPVPFKDDFGYGGVSFKDKIHRYFREHHVSIDEYKIFLRGERIYKTYKNYILDKNGNRKRKKGKKDEYVEIINIGFANVYNSTGKLIALMWYGISNELNFQMNAKNIERGIRLRKGNIGIGSELTLSGLFPQERQNLNYIGEVHALSPLFIPNARRDYFNENQTSKVLETKLEGFFPNLGSLTLDSSELHNRKKDIETYQEEVEKFQQELQNDQLTPKLERERKTQLQKKEKKAIQAVRKIRQIKQKANSNKDLKEVYTNIIDDENLVIPSVEDIVTQDKKSEPITSLPKLLPNQKEIVLEIFAIIDENTNSFKSLTEAEMLKKKIAERYT